MKRIVLALLALTMTLMADATAVYKTKPLYGRKVTAYTFAYKKVSQNIIQLDSMQKVEKIKRGEYVILKDTMPRNPYNWGIAGAMENTTFVVVEYEGQTLAVQPFHLVFDKRKSDKGEKDYLEEYRMSFFQRLWYKPLAITLIFLLVALAYALIWIAGKKEKEEATRMLTTSAYVTCAAGALEMLAVVSVFNGVFWWLNMNEFGLLRTIFGTIPVSIAAIMQFGGMHRYLATLNKLYGSEEQKVSLKPMFKLLGLGVLCLIGVLFVVGIFNSYVIQAILLVGGLIAVYYFFLRPRMAQPISEYQAILGDEMGRMFGIYAFIWTFTSVFAAIFYFVGLSRVLMPLLIGLAILIGSIITFCAFILLLGGPMGAALAKSVPQVMAFYDKAGHSHTSGAARDAANEAMGK